MENKKKSTWLMKISSLLIVVMLLVGMVPVTLSASAEHANVSLVVTADKSEAKPGDTVNFTVTLGPVSEMGGCSLNLVIPDGLTYVSGSGSLSVTKADLGADDLRFEESRLKFDGVWSEADFESSSDIELMTFQCTVNSDATGTQSVGLSIDENDWYSCKTFETWGDKITVSPAEVTVASAEPTEAPTGEPTEAPETGGNSEAPSGVTINVVKDGYNSYKDYWYTGIHEIEINFDKPDDLSEDQIKAAFDQDVSECEDYDRVDWWEQRYFDLSDIQTCLVIGNSVIMVLDIERFVDYRYTSVGFVDGKADGRYTLVFSYDIDSDGKPILYSRDYVIDNQAPALAADAGDTSVWHTSSAQINYSAVDSGAGVKSVRLFRYENGSYVSVDSSTQAEGSFYASESGEYYVKAEDNLGNATRYISVGSIKVDTEAPAFGADVTYDKAAPGSDEWVGSGDTVTATFTVTPSDSGIKSVKIKGTTTDAKDEGDGKYSVTFQNDKDITVVVTGNNDKTDEKVIKAPQFDTTNPDKDSIDHISFSSAEKSKLLNLLTFGLYSNRELVLTVYAKDSGSPITTITVDNDKITANGGVTVDSEGVASRAFVIPAGETAADSDFTNLKFTLTDAAGNACEQAIALTSVDRITLDAESTLEITGEDLKELINTKIAPDIPAVTVTSDDGSVEGFYTTSIKAKADITEELTGLESAKAYFGKADQFDAEDDYKPKEGAKDISDKISEIKTTEKTKKATLQYDVPDDTASGTYLLVIKAVNNSGNPTTKVKEINIDKTAPVITITSKPESWSSSDEPRVKFTVTDQPENSVGVKEVTVDGTVVTADDKGEYSFTPVIGQDAVIKAVDNYNNNTTDSDTDVTVPYTDIKFDDQAPVFGAFSYDNDNNQTWKDSVTVSFTVDDHYDGKMLSNVDPSSFAVTKADGSATDATVVPVYDSTNKIYNCILTATDNNTAYQISVKDFAKNERFSEKTEVLKRDDTAPVIEKIVFSGVNSDTTGALGVFGKGAVTATVYARSGCAAPVDVIKLYNGDAELTPDPENDKIEKEGDLFKRTFILPEADTNGSAYKSLKAYAESAAKKNTGVIGIASINVYYDETQIENHKEFFEAVAKTSGPAIEISYKYPTDKNGINGYTFDENGEIDQYGSYTIKLSDDIAGINNADGKITFYFDKIENFKPVENNGYEPKEGTKVLEGVTLTPDVEDEDNVNKKITAMTGTFTETEPVSGTYVLCAVAENLSGASNSASAAFSVDNTAPVIGNVSYAKVDDKDPTEQWVNSDVTVTFTVTDGPAGCAVGVDDATVTVTGDEDGKSYTVTPGEDNTYSFTTGVSQTYTIKAKDQFTVSAEDQQTKRILVDKEDPHLVIPDLSDYQTNWSKDEKAITFKVDDLSDYFKDADDDDVKKLSGVKSIVITGLTDTPEEGYPLDKEIVKDDGKFVCDETEYTFTADLYQDYTIVVTDEAGNSKTYTDLTNVAIDSKEPYVTRVSFAPKEATSFGKLFNFLTFGLFSSDNVIMTVEAKDDEPSCTLANIVVNGIDNVQETYKQIDGGKPGDSTIVMNFEITPEAISRSTGISYTVTDEVGQKSTITLAQLYKDNNVEVPEGFTFNGIDFKMVVSGNGAAITGPTLTPDNKTPVKTDESGAKWFSSDVTVNIDIEDDLTYLHAIEVTINGESIRNEITDDEGNAIPDAYTVYNKSAAEPGNISEPISQKTIKFNTADLSMVKVWNKEEFEADPVGAKYTLTVTAVSNNGVESTSAVDFYLVDDLAPDITNFKFYDSIEPTGETTNVDEAKQIKDALTSSGYTAMTDANFEYFFKDEAKVTVSATDTHVVDGNEINGTGVKAIELVGVGKKTADSSVETFTFTATNVKPSGIGNLSADFKIPAGFKGSIFARATDMVDNIGMTYSPNNLVVENSNIHADSSGAWISIDNTNHQGTDNNGYALYNGNVDVTFTVEDRYSGIASIEYTADGLEDSAHTSGSVAVSKAGKNSEGWTVSDGEKNLAYKMTKTITLDGFGNFNSNTIKINLTAKDRSGYPIKATEQIISIDTDKPTIEVSYDPAAGSGNTYGSDEYEYFKVSRTMTVTVYERNFNPADFDTSGILNNYVSGDVPALVAGSGWSTDYDYKGTASHQASFTFANDGDYTIKLNYTDEAKNAMDEYTGEKFTIDTIDPTVEISLSGTAKNGKYYNETVTATITVHEHNFAEGDTYVNFVPKCDFDTTYDNSSVTPSISGWSGSGDTHTTTVDFSSDGTYSFTFDYKDKALREAQQQTHDEFVIDKHFDKMIKFIDVKATTAYDSEIAPKVQFDDKNLDTVSTTLTRISLDPKNPKITSDYKKADGLKHALDTNVGSKRVDSYQNFPAEENNDGIYKLHAEGSDKAGNHKEEEIIFSVNRYGSTFMLSPESEEWVNMGYAHDAKDLDVIEINVNEVTDPAVSISHDSQTNTLQKTTDYKWTASGSNESWHRYDYIIPEKNFSGEGGYTVTVSSVDHFKKTVSNRTAYTDKEKDIEKCCPISFVIDRTNPDVMIDGIESDTPYGDPERSVRIICTDTNINPATLQIADEDGNVLAEGTDYTVENLAGELDIELTVSDAGKHSLSVSVDDYALNNGVDEVVNYELNASIFTLFFHNTTAVICTAVGLAAVIALAVFLVLKKRKAKAAK